MTISQNAAPATSTRHVSASMMSMISCRVPRGATGTAALADGPPPNWTAAASPCPVLVSWTSRAAILSAAAASTVPNPTSSLYPPCGRCHVLAVMASSTRAGGSAG